MFNNSFTGLEIFNILSETIANLYMKDFNSFFP